MAGSELPAAQRLRGDDLSNHYIGDGGEGSAIQREVPLTNHSKRYLELLEQRKMLPIYGKMGIIVETVKQNAVTIVVGETGSGKTTQIPQMVADLAPHLSRRVVCTQPRRIAAISVASRVAEEMDTTLGEGVGYHVRFQSLMHPTKTKVLYMTDGMLLRECVTDGDLSSISVVVVDEVHERTRSTDVVLALLKGIAQRRSADFRLVIMSATLDIHKLKQYCPSAPVLTVSGRQYPVEVRYAPASLSNMTEAAINAVVSLHLREPPGDILCFLTGEAEIMHAVRASKQRLRESGLRDGPDEVLMGNQQENKAMNCAILPLFGSLSLPEQKKVFNRYPDGTRKIIFSTNIAETSVTVDGVVYVVDSCYQKQALYDASLRVKYLLPAVISKASAEQRRGRAGRTQPGMCIRLVTREEFATFSDQTYPEMLRSNILDTILLLRSAGVENPCQFDFIDPPSEESMTDAFLQLLHFGAITDSLELTALGMQMAMLPVGASAARMLIRAKEFGCAADIAAIVALTEAGAVMKRRSSSFTHESGDHLVLFFVFHEVLQSGKSPAFCEQHGILLRTMQTAYSIYQQLRQCMERLGIPFTSTYRQQERSVDSVAIRKALLEGLFLQTAYLISPSERKYRTVCDGIDVHLHPECALLRCRKGGNGGALPSWVMYDSLEALNAQDGVRMSVVSEVEVPWLLDVSDYYRSGEDISDREIAFALQQAKEQLTAGQHLS